MTFSGGPAGKKHDYPRLIISWPEHLRAGSRGIANCFLLCPPDYRGGTPEVEVRFDFRMDHDPDDEAPAVTFIRDGAWNFELPISFTTRGEPSRPGRYALEFSLSFPEARAEVEHLLCRVLLTIPDEEEADLATVEGNWQTIQSLDRDTLASLDFVLAQLNMAAEGSLREIPVQPVLSGAGLSSSVSSDVMSLSSLDGTRSQVFQLSVDNSRHAMVPRVSPKFQQREQMDGLGLVFRDGRRILLLSRQTVALGRSRESDIAVRYFPRDAANDHRSKGISRRHVQLELQPDGLCVSDCGSTKGSTLQGRALDSAPQLLTSSMTEKLLLSFSAKAPTDQELPFSMAVKLFGVDRDAAMRLHSADENKTYAEALQTAIPSLWQTATEAGLDAVRLERLTNMRFDELYVLVYRKALLGYCDDVPVFVTDPKLHSRHACFRYANGCFWIENLAEPALTRINGQPLPPYELVPLCAGMELQVGDCRLQVAPWQQLHFDDSGERPPRG